ncbi:uncharacterized protein EAF02_000211 [Botrytis sinoallii]|uniref:uncharacterized protein n=1 Tax=Botrytis sinoallii TaxID=1463999 RepID=UPI0018FFB366|nr:uncharacterized protein EAF02_000211 [Botrytis sinoallii]KAF7892673.1 hypothetical protein EAF02_000211 [Botrytis sinoallii]
MIVSSSDNQTIWFWNIAISESLQILKGYSNLVWLVTFSLDNKVIASNSDNQTIRFWDIATSESLQVFEGYSASGSDDQTIRLWDIATVFECYSISNHWIVEIINREMRNTIWLPSDYQLSITFCYKGIIALGVPFSCIFILKLEYESFISFRSKQALI